MMSLHNQLYNKLNKAGQSGISMRFRLFLFLSVLVLTMVAGIVVILLVTGTFTAGISESRQLVRNELSHTSQDIAAQFGEMSVNTVDFSQELSQKIESSLKDQNLTFSDLSDHPDRIEALVMDLFEKTYYSLEKSNCSGAFFILDTTVNTSLKDSEYSKAGLYIKNMEPNVISSSSPNFTILRGFSSIGRNNSINLHTQWSMEFDVADADYYYEPMNAFQTDKNIELSQAYYWSELFVIPGTSEEVMLCTVPLIDSKNNLYGVCGFEISAMLFKLSHMPSNNTYSRMFCVLSSVKDSLMPVSRSLIAGGYSVKDISKDITDLKLKDNGSSFATYTGGKDTVFVGYHSGIQLYPKGSPFSEKEWITAILVPKEDVVDSIMQLNIILACLLSLLVTGGIITSIIVSNKYLKPISDGIEIIKSIETEEIPKTKVQEIDDLIDYLSQYKKGLNKKVEQDKYQISMLEEFVKKTKTLTPAEHSVFGCYIKGLSAKETAEELFLSINTIKTHSKHIFAKLNVATREELLLYISMLKEIGLELK